MDYLSIYKASFIGKGESEYKKDTIQTAHYILISVLKKILRFSI